MEAVEKVAFLPVQQQKEPITIRLDAQTLKRLDSPAPIASAAAR